MQLTQTEIPSEHYTQVKGHFVTSRFSRGEPVVFKRGSLVRCGLFVAATGFNDSCKVRIGETEYTLRLGEVKKAEEHKAEISNRLLEELRVKKSDLIKAWGSGLRTNSDLAKAIGSEWPQSIPKQITQLKKLGLVS